MAFDFLSENIAQQKQRARYRVRQCVAEQNGRFVKIEDETYLNFSSNDYLGLNHHPEINQA